MPALEMAQETGKIIKWHKKEGESTAKGDILLEVETDKAVVEIESPGEGILAGVLAQEGAEIPVGKVIAWLVSPGETPPEVDDAAPAARQATSARPRSSPAPNPSPVGTPTATERRISPKARRLAREHGIDLNRVRGSGAEGEVLASDILALVESKTTDEASEELTALNAVGRLTAERTAQSWTTAPHFYLHREADAQGLVEARAKLGPSVESSQGVRLTHTDLLIAVVARVLEKFPRINASWAGNGILVHRRVNVAFAVAVEGGVQGPVIHDAARLSLNEIAQRRNDLATRARAGRLRPADIKDGTFTISNLGTHGIDSFSAIITAPQAAVLAVGRIADRVVPFNGQPAIRPMVSLTLSCDHRVIDGALGATFLQSVSEGLREPEKWLA